MNTINIISDDIFFLRGAAILLNDALRHRNKLIKCYNTNEITLRNLMHTLAHEEQKVVLYIHCIKKRRVILRLIAAYNLQAFIIIDCKKTNQTNNPFIIPSFASKKEFIRKISTTRKKGYMKHSLTSKIIFKSLSSGMCLGKIANKLKMNHKSVCAIKNLTLKHYGLKTTKMHGFLICRDLLEMNAIGLQYNSLKRK